MPDYVPIALSAARRRGLAATAIAALDYRGVAGLCGVTVTAKGDSPADFFYVPTRDAVKRELAADEAEVAQKARLAAAQERLRQIFPQAITMVDSDGAERFFHDGKIPASVTEKQWRTIEVGTT